jgi:threonine/homoserine/homoserine lactone efflux protein
LILDLFLIGLVVTLEPIPLSAFILLLAAERGLLKGLGFVIGWLGTLVLIVALVVVVTGGKPLIPKSSPSTAALVVKLTAGAVLIWIAERRRRRLSRASSDVAPETKKQPRWMARIDQVNPFAAAGLGFLLQPWVLVTAGVTTIVEGKLDTPVEYLAVFGFAVWCSASYLGLETYAALRPDVVKDRLQALLDWINTHTDQAIVFLSLFLGLYLMGKAIYGLVSA